LIDLNRIERRVSKIKYGIVEMRKEAQKIVSEESPAQSLKTAESLYRSDTYQVRIVAVFVLGFIASNSEEALQMIRKKVSQDNPISRYLTMVSRVVEYQAFTNFDALFGDITTFDRANYMESL
jgi:hypothetical protein